MTARRSEPSRDVIRLAWLIAALALAATLAGLFVPAGSGPAVLQSVRGEQVELFGHGLYRHDTQFKGASNVGTDVVTLALAIPLLIGSTARYRRGSWRGGLLLLCALGWFAYVYATYALSVAFNELFLVYVALFSACVFAFVMLWRALEAQPFGMQLPERVRRATATLLTAGGALTFSVWALPLLGAIVSGDAPKWLGSSTTMVTDALDLAIITPSALLAGALLRRREERGYLLAVPLLGLLVILAPAIGAQTISQLAAGIDFTAGEVIGPMLGFIALGSVAAWCLTGLVRAAPPRPSSPGSRGAGSPAAAAG